MSTVTQTLAPTPELAPVSLDELNATAALLTRRDRKYLLDHAGLDQLLHTVGDEARMLTIGGRSQFGYESRYFDTPELDSYRLTALGRMRRYKVRTRRYRDSGLQYLEVKTRRGQHSAKVRTTHLGTMSQIDTMGRAFATHVLDQAGVDSDRVRDLRVVLTTRYQRRTLLLPAESARVTIDTDLAWVDEHGNTLSRPDLVVVETKTAGAPSSVDRALWRLGQRPQPISKYATAMAALDPTLPRHRWNRTLRRHFERVA